MIRHQYVRRRADFAAILHHPGMTMPCSIRVLSVSPVAIAHFSFGLLFAIAFSADN